VSDVSRIAVVPGSFDPVTLGHLDVIGRAAGLFDELHVLVVHNPDKSALLPIAQRVSLIQEAVAEAEAARQHPRHVVERRPARPTTAPMWVRACS